MTRVSDEQHHKCEACGLQATTEYIRVRTTNGGLLLCVQCLGDINRKNPAVKLASWYGLLAVTAERGLWKWSSPGVVVVAKDRFNAVFDCERDASGLPVETPELRAAIEEALGQTGESP